eukprot:GILI01037548.1.p1 GENE.GILI01037548.1~~GILI01037548.1.p1  ORF type:complete len:180 (+),score=28.85 GILI01037548.1:36-575(+)
MSAFHKALLNAKRKQGILSDVPTEAVEVATPSHPTLVTDGQVPATSSMASIATKDDEQPIQRAIPSSNEGSNFNSAPLQVQAKAKPSPEDRQDGITTSATGGDDGQVRTPVAKPTPVVATTDVVVAEVASTAAVTAFTLLLGTKRPRGADELGNIPRNATSAKDVKSIIAKYSSGAKRL